jgi:hypothetical protein
MKQEDIEGDSDVKEEIMEEGSDKYFPSMKLENIGGFDKDVKEEIKYYL